MLVNPFPASPSIGTVTVDSSVIREVTYDHQREILVVRFCDRTTYQYSTVPLRVYQEFLRADSKGVYFNRHIRGRFPQRILTAPDRSN